MLRCALSLSLFFSPFSFALSPFEVSDENGPEKVIISGVQACN